MALIISGALLRLFMGILWQGNARRNNQKADSLHKNGIKIMNFDSFDVYRRCVARITEK
jgi:hypothetical protein